MPPVTCRTSVPDIPAARGNHLFRGLGREVEGLKGSHTLLRRFRRACNTKQERGGKELSFLVLSSSRLHGERTKAMQAGRTYSEALASEVVSHGSTFTFVTERLSPLMTPNADHLLDVSRVIVTESFASQ